MHTQIGFLRPVGGGPVAVSLVCRTIIAVGILLGSLAFAQSTSSAKQPQEPSQQASPTPAQTQPDLQTNSPPVAPVSGNSAVSDATDKNAPEIATQETESTFQVRVNLVEVRVVVRDAHGRPVSGLKKEDFQLLDDGKPQVITRFLVEGSGAEPSIHHETAESPETRPASGTAPGISLPPQHYVAYLFDDVHLPFSALATARIAAIHHLQSLPVRDRAAIYTTSGQTQMDFTDDRDALRDRLNRLMPRPITSSTGPECPHMTYYMADMIENRGDTEALKAATLDAQDCAFAGAGSAASEGAAASMARNAARQQLYLNAHETQVALDTLRRVVQRVAIMPGQRTIVLVSPGFLNIDEQQEQVRIVERALHAGIVINTLDARGLYTVGDDASKKVPPRHLRSIWENVDERLQHYAELEKSAQADVLRGLAEDTGGTFFNNSNDLKAGFEAGTPETSYLLAFSPLNLKLDGRFHNLKVTVVGKGLSIQARKGYYAPKQAENAVEQAKRDIEDAVFSQQEWHDIPVQVHTQFFKSSDQDAKLSVLVKVDARRLHFRKVDGRNRNDVTVVSALFDRNGKFISGSQKVLQMRLKDETLGSKLISALTLKSSFDVKAGSYLVRLVVRDDGGHLTAQNDAVEIP